MATDREWLAALKTGDSVIVQHGLGGREESLMTVYNTTPTQIVVGDNRYNRKDGRERGGQMYYTKWLRQPTPKDVARVKRQNAVRALHSVKWQDLPDAVLFAAMKLIVSGREGGEA